MSKVSKNLKKIRTTKKITQDALAEKLHVTRQAISNWENDKTKPDIESLEMLAQVLEVDIEELIYGEKKEVVVSQDKTKQKNRIKITLAVVGSIFVASGLAILFFGFWQDFSISLQTAFSVIPMIAGQGFALYTYLKKKNSPSWRECAGIIWTIGTVATIALVDAIHNISWSYTDYLVIDSALLIPILFVFGSVSKDKEIIIFNNLNDVSDNIYKKIKEFKPENEERVAVYIHGKKTLDAIKFNKDFNIETNKKLINLFTKNAVTTIESLMYYIKHDEYAEKEKGNKDKFKSLKTKIKQEEGIESDFLGRNSRRQKEIRDAKREQSFGN